ncbi:unnamed protein product, partial [marine sediment metagenome]
HSMAKAMTIPVEMVSIVYLLQSSLALAMYFKSEIPQREPKETMVSYSGPP